MTKTSKFIGVSCRKCGAVPIFNPGFRACHHFPQPIPTHPAYVSLLQFISSECIHDDCCLPCPCLRCMQQSWDVDAVSVTPLHPFAYTSYSQNSLLSIQYLSALHFSPSPLSLYSLACIELFISILLSQFFFLFFPLSDLSHAFCLNQVWFRKVHGLFSCSLKSYYLMLNVFASHFHSNLALSFFA